MKPHLFKTPASASLTALALCLLTPVYAADPAPRRDTDSTALSTKSAGWSARDVIGQDVRSTANEDLGEIKDIVVSTLDGKIAYALVGTGGVLGIGQKIRAVPFSALKNPTDGSRELRLEVTGAKWAAAPLVQDSDTDLLATEERGRSLYEYYGTDWNRERLRSDSPDRTNRLIRVSKLIGKDIHNAGQEVGEIEDVLVDRSSRQASALLDPDDDYTGTDQKYLIGFDQLMVSTDREGHFATTLTRADFQKAKPARAEWWTERGGYPYAWTGYTYIQGVGYAPGSMAVRTDETVARTDRRDDDDKRVTVTEVRQALDQDPALKDAARHVILREEDRKLVVRGTAVSKDVKEQIMDRVEALAKGWNVDDEIEVKRASE